MIVDRMTVQMSTVCVLRVFWSPAHCLQTESLVDTQAWVSPGFPTKPLQNLLTQHPGGSQHSGPNHEGDDDLAGGGGGLHPGGHLQLQGRENIRQLQHAAVQHRPGPGPVLLQLPQEHGLLQIRWRLQRRI